MLTRSQRKTYEFVKEFVEQKDYSPTVAEIARGIGIRSRGVVHRYLKVLDEKGYIRLLPNRHRNIQMLEHDPSMLIPLVGSIAAGRPIEAIQSNESINVASVFLGPNRYALRVKGDSMVDEGIFDGDIVICERRSEAKNGEIVVALVDQDQATLKRFYYHSDETVSLVPANAAHQRMVYLASRVQVQGIYIGLLRFCKAHQTVEKAQHSLVG